MLSDAGIECVGGQSVFPSHKAEAAGGDDNVGILAFYADRAVAVFNFNAVRQKNFKPDGAAMAAALVPGHIFISHRMSEPSC